MPRRPLPYLAALLLFASPAAAQESAFRDDLRFVEALRADNKSDLALKYLQKLAKTAPPDLKKELSLEFAKTSLAVARSEPESGKRLELYREARENFQKFIADFPGHPRIAEANVDIARVLNAQGKTEMNRALLNPEPAGKKEDAAKARNTLADAGKRLELAIAELEGVKAKMPDPEGVSDKILKIKAQQDMRRIDAEISLTKLERALNFYEQSETYLEAGSLEASKLLQESVKLLQDLEGGAATNPVTWKARAWLGRCVYEIETADKARALFQRVLVSAGTPATADGVRLARYFRMLLIQKSPNDEEKKKGVAPVIQDAAERWLRDYPAYRNTSEGYGVAFLLAGLYLERGSNAKLPKPEQDRLLNEAKALLRSIEGSENEFTDRARSLKITTLAKQGRYTKKVPELTSFEDCFARVQYELYQMGQDATTIKDDKERDKKRDERIGTIIQALTLGLKKPDAAKRVGSLELNTARSTLAYWCLETKRYAEAAEAGESFARESPKSNQAAMASVYALEAYAKLIADKQSREEDAAAERAKQVKLAQYMEETWPKELPGDTARLQLGMQAAKEENFPVAIQKLGAIPASSPAYIFSRYWLADSAFKADKAKAAPLPGDKEDGYRRRALEALEGMPESALGPNTGTNHLYYMGKALLGREMFKSKRFTDMDALAGGLLKKLPEVKFNPDPERDTAIRAQLRFELTDVELFARYGLVDAAFTKNEHAKVVELTDPLVDAVVKDGEAPAKQNMQKNPQLANAILARALQSNLQLGKIDRTDAVLDVIDKVSATDMAGVEGGNNEILKRLAGLIRQQVEEIRKKNDKAALDTAVAGYTKLLDKRISKQKNLTPEFILVLADCYAGMEQHEKAAGELGKIADPKAKPGTPEERTYRSAQLLHVRELRLAKTEDSLKKATEVMEKVLGAGPPEKRDKWGWGRTNLDALKENGLLLQAKGNYRDAFAVWSALVPQLAKKAPTDNRIRDYYLEAYFNLVLSFYKNGQTLADKEKRDRSVEDAARQVIQIEKAWPDFGTEVSKKRFQEMLAAEAPLKEKYEALKKK